MWGQSLISCHSISLRASNPFLHFTIRPGQILLNNAACSLGTETAHHPHPGPARRTIFPSGGETSTSSAAIAHWKQTIYKSSKVLVTCTMRLATCTPI